MNLASRQWLALLRPGDWLVIAMGLALAGYAFVRLWQGGAPDGAEIRAGGKVFARLALDRPQIVEVPGPLGTTRVEIQPGRARVASDPGPRQYCVRQGWLSRAGAVAICAPNHVTLALTGGQHRSVYFAERLAESFRDTVRTLVRHRSAARRVADGDTSPPTPPA